MSSLINHKQLTNASRLLYMTHLAIGDFLYQGVWLNALKAKYPHLTIDVWFDDYDLRMEEMRPLPTCVTCQRGEYPALTATATPAVKLCGRDAVQVHPRAGATIDMKRLARNLEGTAEDLEVTPHLLRFRVEGCRFSVFAGGRALLFGTDDTERARILYDRYVGA